jgi:hypothetical protein
MAKLNYQKWIELLSVILHCPVCSNKYNAEQTSIIESKDPEKYENSSLLVHTECERCKSSVVFSIALDGPEVFSVGMVTDLNSTDAKRFRDADSISLNEVIDFHEFLSVFDGDFERMLH